MSDQDELKNISIRGVNADVYDLFSDKVKNLELNIGQALTKLMEDVIADFDETFPEVSSESFKTLAKLKKGNIQHQRKLSISKNDLVSADMRFYFQHIDHLEFAADVDLETFEKFVGGIQHVDNVRLPNIMPRLKVLAFVQHCHNVEVYDVQEETLTTSNIDGE